MLLNQKVYPSIARMAESVDALVSNTSGALRAGSIPAPGTSKRLSIALSLFCLYPISYLLRLRFVHRKGRFVENNLPITVFVHNSGLSVEKLLSASLSVHQIEPSVENALQKSRVVHRKGRFVEKHHYDSAIVHHIRIFVEDSYVVSFSWFT